MLRQGTNLLFSVFNSAQPVCQIGRIKRHKKCKNILHGRGGVSYLLLFVTLTKQTDIRVAKSM